MADRRDPKPAQRRPERWDARFASDDGLIRRLHRRLPEIFLLSYAGLVAYVSLLPFGVLSLGGIEGSLDFSGMTKLSAGLKDILPNIFLYVPLGAVGYVVARRGEWGRVASSISAVALCTGLSLLLELLQQLVAVRVSSMVDVVSNVSGGCIGALLGRTSRRLINKMIRRGRWELRYLPLTTTARAYVVLVVVAGLIPLDITYDIHKLGRAVKHAKIVPFADLETWEVQARQLEIAEDLPGYMTLQRMRVDYGLDMIAEAASFGLLGILLSLSFRREHATGRIEGWLVATIYAGVLGAGLTGLQLFVISRGFDAGAIVVRAAAGSLASALAMPFIRSEPPRGRTLADMGPQGLNLRMARLLTVLVVVYILARGFSPLIIHQDDRVAETNWHGIGIVPMAGYFQSRFSTSVDDIVYKVLRFGVFGVVAALGLGLRPSKPFYRRAGRIAVAGGLISSGIEVAQVYLPTRWPDVTHVLLAMFGSFGGAIGIRWVNDYYHSVRVRWLADFIASREPGTAALFNVELPPSEAQVPGGAASDPSRDMPVFNVEIATENEAGPREPTPTPEPQNPPRSDGDEDASQS